MPADRRPAAKAAATPLEPVTATAHARAGLLGNPSDVYGGKAVALSLANFGARVRIEPAARFRILRGEAETLDFDSVRDLVARLAERGFYDGIRLLRAALSRFDRHFPLEALDPDDARLRFEVSYATDVPRQAGLAGSSAIVVAALRALATWFEVELPPAELAELALAAEVEDLGITAGPMDRVTQAYGGLMHMDFRPPREAASYRRLDPALLPPLFVAWDPAVGKASQRVHGDVRARWERGDPEVRAAIEAFPRLVDEGLACLEAGDVAGFQKCVDANFDTRASIWTLSPRDLELVRLGRECGAAVKFCGSGGAVIGVLSDESQRPAVERAYRAAGLRSLRPRIGPAEPA